MSTPKITGELLRKYVANQCTEAERAGVESWYNELAEHNQPSQPLEWEDIEATDQYFQTVFKDKLVQKNPAKVNRFTFSKVAAAIAVLISLSLLVYYYQYSDKEPYPTTLTAQSFKPGTFQANIQHGSRTEESTMSGHALVLKQQDIRETLLVSTSTGQEYQLTLPDATVVFLNAQSKVTLPADYNQQNRTVYLEGEAFFKVAKDKSRPFIVHVADAQVEALGTEFNIRYYPSENHTFETFLKEGAVRLTHKKEELIMEPGDALVVNTLTGQNKLQKKQVDLHQLAWKEGYFEYNNTPLLDIVQELSRWYNFEYEIDPAYNRKTLSGKISRQQPFQEILTILQFSGIPYQMHDNLLKITPNK
ncbi:MAG: FecR domain-containing protein [Sphingobacterium sp.]|jgi:ferric-dicitrate binding protein FerR (iron transport regulator)|nr:FecR domain-containing protein [Sphingobacterium sp.]